MFMYAMFMPYSTSITFILDISAHIYFINSPQTLLQKYKPRMFIRNKLNQCPLNSFFSSFFIP